MDAGTAIPAWPLYNGRFAFEHHKEPDPMNRRMLFVTAAVLLAVAVLAGTPERAAAIAPKDPLCRLYSERLSQGLPGTVIALSG